MIKRKLSELLKPNPGLYFLGQHYIDYKKDFKGFWQLITGEYNPPDMPVSNHLVRFKATFPEYPNEEVGLFIEVPLPKDGVNGITQMYRQDPDQLVEITSFLEGLTVTDKDGNDIEVTDVRPSE